MPINLNSLILRDESAGDIAFLREVFNSARQGELAASELPEQMWAGLLEMQFKAQQQGYRATFPKARFYIIQFENKNIGRLVVNRGETEFLLLDIALLPEFRGRGIGTALIQRLSNEASATGCVLRLDVIKGGRAARLYQRLGFVKISESGMHDRMELQPSQS